MTFNMFYAPPKFCKTYLLFLLPLLTAAFTRNCVAQKAGSSGRPNVIVIFSDDHAYQAISAYGSTLVKTPNIDRIAREGAVFKNTFVTNSICGPSRATLLTG